MSVVSTILVYVIIPVAVIALVATLVVAGTDRAKPSRRYRPGRPYDFAPMWFLASPSRSAVAERPATRSALAIEDGSGTPVRPGPTGGASDKW